MLVYKYIHDLKDADFVPREHVPVLVLVWRLKHGHNRNFPGSSTPPRSIFRCNLNANIVSYCIWRSLTMTKLKYTLTNDILFSGGFQPLICLIRGEAVADEIPTVCL